MPESDHWLTKASTHIAASSLLAFTMFCESTFYNGEDKQVNIIHLAYSSSLRAPFSSALRVCLTVNTKEFFGNVRCQVVSAMYAISWVAPFPSEFRYMVQFSDWILTVSRPSAHRCMGGVFLRCGRHRYFNSGVETG